MGWKTFALAALLAAAPVGAQGQDLESGHIALGGGYGSYDLNGTGSTGIFTLRVGAPVAPSFGWEIAVSYLSPGDGDVVNVNMFLPELQLQLMKAFGKFTPYLGIGAGASIMTTGPFTVAGVEFDGETEIDFAPSASLGARAGLTDSVGLFAEGRIHGIEIDFTGTVAELVGGLSFAF